MPAKPQGKSAPGPDQFGCVAFSVSPPPLMWSESHFALCNNQLFSLIAVNGLLGKVPLTRRFDSLTSSEFTDLQR